jgi:hypothetical protein
MYGEGVVKKRKITGFIPVSRHGIRLFSNAFMPYYDIFINRGVSGPMRPLVKVNTTLRHFPSQFFDVRVYTTTSASLGGPYHSNIS